MHNWIQKSVYSFMIVLWINTYIKRAKELGYQALSLMDRDISMLLIILLSYIVRFTSFD